MGSVQAFPRRPGASTLADVWRVAPIAQGDALRVRPMRIADCGAIRALERQAMSGLAPSTLQQLEGRRHAFAEGQLVAEAGGLIVGALGSFLMNWDDAAAGLAWAAITGDGAFTRHDPLGRTLYGTESIVDLTGRGYGVARALHHAQRRLCRRLNLRRIIMATRLVGYREVRDHMTPDRYAMKVICGDVANPALGFPMSLGFHYGGILHGYRPDDAESCGHAALLAWINPLYEPPRPPAAIESANRRKCA